jgi:hypothetical protein
MEVLDVDVTNERLMSSDHVFIDYVITDVIDDRVETPTQLRDANSFISV